MPIRRPRTPKPTLRHLGFLEAMEQVPEGSEPWKALTSGLLTLRQVDHWMSLGDHVTTADNSSWRATHAAIEALPELAPERALLAGIMQTIAAMHEPDAQPLLPRVFAYAGLLERKAQLGPAREGYRAVVRYVDARVDFDLAYDATMRIAFCDRMLGEHDEAVRLYRMAETMAKGKRDLERVLRAEIGQAIVAEQRGNLPEAETALTEVIARAEGAGFRELQGLAMHTLAGVRRFKGEFASAAEIAFDAMQLVEQPTNRERLLSDLSVFLMQLGRYDSARDAMMIIEATTTSEENRWHAWINLMDLAVRESNEISFESHRRQLESLDLPTTIRLNFLIDSARGHAHFGRPEAARRAFAEAAALASAHGFHQREFQIAELESNITPAPHTDSSDELGSLRRISTGLHEMYLAISGAQ